MYSKNDLYITSNDFASFSNIIYSDRQEYSKEFFNNNIEIIEYSEEKQFKHITYKRLSFEITSGDVIFCNTNQIDNLFYHLSKLQKIEDIILITHQTDRLISKKYYQKKPPCVKKWLTVNVGFNNPNLHPIPIGIASDFSLKNLIFSDFQEFKKNNFKKDDVSLYVNYQNNTNYSERSHIAEMFVNNDWVNFDEPNLNKKEYMAKLANSTFVLCPWGNGIDTHRLWETLYLGSIPITKSHPTFNFDEELPILFVNDYDEITYDLLNNYLDSFEFKNYNFDILTKNYWRKYINDMKSNHSYSETVNEKFYVTAYFKSKRVTLNKLSSMRKKIVTYFYKAKRRLGL
ncbi:MAG: hypothetical protein CBD44_00990 [Flavobacteriaceae bacterium TMED184]|nr:MAG: hypothetical protein CBD44_00990 [Flavobacteriaceae bacterium TMED184]|tara:strand:+ start:9870 stop:10901 length:1032 start_codon:yes stop_codon:yes gene_type:complete